MIIESIHIRSFGRLRDYECSFDPRFQIIEGPNEAGKSTLAAFIRYMLYGFPGRGGSDPGEKKRRISWQDGCAAGAMTVRLSDGRRYRIERATTASAGAAERESYREVSTVVDLSTNTPLPGNEPAGERFLGVPESVYVNTAFVGQIGTPRVGGPEVNEAIENLLFAGDEDLNVKRALDKLDTLRRTLLYKNGKGGEIAELEKQREQLTRRLDTAREQNAEVLAREAELEATSNELAEAEKQLAAATARERDAQNILIVAAYDHLHEAERQKQEAEDALREMDGMPAYRLDERDLQELRERRRAAEEAQARHLSARHERELRAALPLSDEDRAYLEKAEREGGVEELAGNLRRAGRRQTLFGALLLLSLLVMVAGLPFGAPLLYVFLGVGAAALIAAAVLFLRARTDLLAICRSYDTRGVVALRRRIEQLRAGKDTLSLHTEASARAYELENECLADYHRTLGELDTVVRRFDARLPAEEMTGFLNTLEDAARAVMERKKSYEAIRVSSKEVIAGLERQLAGTNEAAAREALAPGVTVRVEDIRLDTLRSQREFYAGQQRLFIERRREIERLLFAARSRAEDPAALQTELDDVLRRLRSAREQYDACVLAHDAIAGAGERLREQIAPTLSNFSCRMISHLTDGRYERIGVDNRLAVTFGTESGTYPLDYMSAGTQDLAYLSLRMALIDLLYREKPPVCFDESFAHQDDDRAARMMEALYTLSDGGQQNLLFTCHQREEQLANERLGNVAALRMRA